MQKIFNVGYYYYRLKNNAFLNQFLRVYRVF